MREIVRSLAGALFRLGPSHNLRPPVLRGSTAGHRQSWREVVGAQWSVGLRSDHGEVYVAGLLLEQIVNRTRALSEGKGPKQWSCSSCTMRARKQMATHSPRRYSEKANDAEATMMKGTSTDS